ncbi:MAG: hypothetical protein G01um101425_1029 [Candidatus Peregrinibacteria bacterium Gr01-1014_25]|nr:MAG: hypothetical protein G01um101425_1029 [Candidatus Peregrinibacteria bacterium Gr01-1014_25]
MLYLMILPVLLRRIVDEPIRFILVPLLVFSILWKGGKGLETTWLMVLGVCALAVVQWRDRGEQAARPPALLVLCAAAFVAWTVLAYLFSRTATYGLDEVLRDAALAAALLWSAGISTDRERRAALGGVLIRVIVAATFAASVIGLAVYVLQPVDRFVGTFFDFRFHTDYWPNAWADLVLLAWPLAALHAARAIDARQRRIRLVILGVILGALLVSLSRGAFVAALGQIALAGCIVVRRRGLRSLRTALVPTLLTATVAAAFFINANALRSVLYSVQDVGDRITFTSADGATSIAERQQFWRQAWTLALKHPVTGWGPYSFRFVQPRLQEGILATSDHPHNVILKLAMERGMPAALLFLVLLVLALFPPLRALLHDVPGSGDSLSFAALIACAGVLAHSLIDYNLQFVGVAFPLWLLLGVLAAGGGMSRLHFPALRRCAPVIATAALIIACVEAPFLILSSLGRHAEARGDDRAAMQWYALARRERFSRDLHVSRAQLYLRQGRLGEAASAIADALERNPEDYRAWKISAIIERRRGALEDAQAAQERALALGGATNDISVLAGFVRITLERGERDVLAQRRAEFLGIARTFAEAIDRNAHFIALGPNAEAFADVVDALGQAYPEDEAQLQVLAARVDRKKREERMRYEARPPGWLW